MFHIYSAPERRAIAKRLKWFGIISSALMIMFSDLPFTESIRPALFWGSIWIILSWRNWYLANQLDEHYKHVASLQKVDN